MVARFHIPLDEIMKVAAQTVVMHSPVKIPQSEIISTVLVIGSIVFPRVRYTTTIVG